MASCFADWVNSEYVRIAAVLSAKAKTGFGEEDADVYFEKITNAYLAGKIDEKTRGRLLRALDEGTIEYVVMGKENVKINEEVVEEVQNGLNAVLGHYFPAFGESIVKNE